MDARQYFLMRRLPEGETELSAEWYAATRSHTRLMPNAALTFRDRAGEGLSWAQLGPGNIGGRARSLLIHPQNPSIMYAGAVTGGVPAHPGDLILFYGTGFGPTSPETPIGTTFGTANPLANQVTVTIGGISAVVQFAGLTAPGEYQFNVFVPNVPVGDNLVVMKVGGVTTQPNAYLAVR